MKGWVLVILKFCSIVPTPFSIKHFTYFSTICKQDGFPNDNAN